MKRIALIFTTFFLFLITQEVIAQTDPEIIFETSFTADWAHIDRQSIYDYAPTAMDDNQWKVWHCGEKSQGTGQDAVFFTSFKKDGQYDIPTTRVLSPKDNISSAESLHVCAPSVVKHSFSQIESGKDYFKIYYECAPKVYSKADPSQWAGAFTQICHAVSDDGISWKKWNEALWDSEFRYGDSFTEPSPVRKLAQKVIDNCDYEFKDGKHQADLAKCININNYGVGHPSTVVFDLNGADPDGEQIWLYYYDSKGEWSERGVYLAKSWDGFNFETPVRTNLKNPIEVKYFNLQIGGYQGVFIGTMGMEGDNYFAYSFDGLNWEWANFADFPEGNFDNLKIGTAMVEHCAAPSQAAIIGDEHGRSSSWFVNILSGEGFLGTNDGGNEYGCYSASEDSSRGSTWGIYLIQGTFKEILASCDIIGDINGDCIVNILDFQILSNAFGTSDPDSDLNGDEIVNILDFQILSNNFGEGG